ncbi:DUF4232 domain-containing protein [Streptomyces phyllanthi]|uniref:DUF4232 domain-containing protein n=1 Tax=Streptomyces phyllanthi TaxID=1803180 RepID=A0A5N8W7J2_9ACTN|nr:DUF4232 domain-containing protein [Streptomyces phyllanthi]MPY43451.1 DUF4232 domain-containing protein [Streptomyces phyllanthi]
MSPIRRRTAPSALPVAAVTALVVSGCGLSAELEREADPGRTGRPSVTAASAGAEPPGLSPSDPPIDTGPLDPPAPMPSDSCPSSGVRIEPGPVSAAMGLRAMGVTLTNCGRTTYRLAGYPKLQVLDEHREPLDVQILQGTEPITTGQPDSGPKPVTLKPGESAMTELVWRNTVTDTTTTAVNGTYLRITPAKGGPSEVITPQGRIDLGNTGRIGTTAWEKTPAP